MENFIIRLVRIIMALIFLVILILAAIFAGAVYLVCLIFRPYPPDRPCTTSLPTRR